MSKISIKYVDINQEQVILVDGLTLDDIKAKFSWILNARTKNAILGKNDDTLIWYSGNWIDGEWFEGIWYSGIFERGVWLNGIFNSVQFDMKSLLNGNFLITDINNKYSHFLTGNWYDGNFENGTFGIDGDFWNDQTIYDIDYKNYSLDWNSNSSNTNWYYGNFNNGYFINSNWISGNFNNGYLKNSLWNTGDFYNGIFDGYEWKNGNFKGGDFVFGKWRYGIVNQINVEVPARFGATNENYDYTVCEWYDGIFENGSFHSGLKFDNSGNTINSTNHKMTIWYGGIWNFGKWYGGQFLNGIWYSGIWFDGVWGAWSSVYKNPNYIENYSSTINDVENSIDNDENTYLYRYGNINSNPNNDYYYVVYSGFTFDDYKNKSELKGVEILIDRSGFYDKISHANTKDYNISIFNENNNISRSGFTDVNGLDEFFNSGVSNDYWYFSGKTSNPPDKITFSGVSINDGDSFIVYLESDLSSHLNFDVIILNSNGTNTNTNLSSTKQYIILNPNSGISNCDIQFLIRASVGQDVSYLTKIYKIKKNINARLFSENNSFEIENIKYGSYNNNLGLILNNSSETNETKLLISAVSNRSYKTSPTFKVESRIHDVNVKLYHTSKPVWSGGTWYNGVFIDGYFLKGNFKGGNVINGVFENVNYF
jgi:hypothetical protein